MSPNEHAAPAAVGRRDFLRLVGAAGLASLLPAAGAAAAPAAAPADTVAKPAPPDAPSAEAVALAAILRGRFPDRLDEAQWAAVTAELDGRLASGRRLAALELANGDEPDAVFRA